MTAELGKHQILQKEICPVSRESGIVALFSLFQKRFDHERMNWKFPACRECFGSSAELLAHERARSIATCNTRCDSGMSVKVTTISKNMRATRSKNFTFKPRLWTLSRTSEVPFGLGS